MTPYILEKSSLGYRLFKGSKLLAQRVSREWVYCPTKKFSPCLREHRYYELPPRVGERILLGARPTQNLVDMWDEEFFSCLLTGEKG